MVETLIEMLLAVVSTFGSPCDSQQKMVNAEPSDFWKLSCERSRAFTLPAYTWCRCVIGVRIRAPVFLVHSQRSPTKEVEGTYYKWLLSPVVSKL